MISTTNKKQSPLTQKPKRQLFIKFQSPNRIPMLNFDRKSLEVLLFYENRTTTKQ